MKVPLFLGFGDILMLKFKSQKHQILAFGDHRGMTQKNMGLSQRVSFWSYLAPV